MTRRLLIAAIDGQKHQCSINFLATMLKVQASLGRSTDVSASIDFFVTPEAAFQVFCEGGFDTCVILESTTSVDAAFVVDPPEYDTVLAPCPLPELDWKRAERVLKDPDSTERPEYVANVYNIDPVKATVVSPRYLKVSGSDVKEARALKLRKGVGFLLPKDVYVDLNSPAATMGTVAYTGCVGKRKVLR